MSDEQLKKLYFQYKTCTACNLYRNRKVLIGGVGSPQASVVFLLDRPDPDDVYTGVLLSGGQGRALKALLGQLAHTKKEFWITPVVSCPTMGLRPSRNSWAPQVLPLAKIGETASCRPRVFSEVHVIQPEIVIAFGALSLKSLFPKNPPKHGENLGRIIDAMIPGDLVSYAVPVMVTHSLNALYRDSAQKYGGIWNKTIVHIKQAIEIAERLKSTRRC